MIKSMTDRIKRIMLALLAMAMTTVAVAALSACDDRSSLRHDFVSIRTLHGGYIYLHIQDNLGSLALPARPIGKVTFARDEDTMDALISTMELYKDDGVVFNKLDEERILVEYDKGEAHRAALITRDGRNKNGRYYVLHDLSAFLVGSDFYVMTPLQYYVTLPESNATYGYKELVEDSAYALAEGVTIDDLRLFYEKSGYSVKVDGVRLEIKDLAADAIPDSYYKAEEKTRPESIEFTLTFEGGAIRYSAA